MDNNIDTINCIRGFNRFYTNILGLLDQHILNSDYSLTEARILFELHEMGSCMAHTLAVRLNIDKSYMSRIIGRFVKKGLISKTVSSNDSRASYIELTEQGCNLVDNLSQASNYQIEQLLAPLTNDECRDICMAMETISKHFTKATTKIKVREFTNSDIDYIILRQLNLYKAEYGFDTDIWKSYVTDGVYQLVNHYDPEKDVIYILEANDSISGCIAVTHIEEDTAQLRFFFVESALRGLGAGNKLIKMALGFCKEKNYKHICLWTFSKLDAARHLYSKNGFKIAGTHENHEWGEPVLEEQWKLELEDN